MWPRPSAAAAAAVAPASAGAAFGGGGVGVGVASGAAASAAAPGCIFRGAVRRVGMGTEASAAGRLPHDRACQAAWPASARRGFRQAAINNPGGRFDNRFGNRGDWRYGYGATGGRYPYYGGRYPYYGGRYPYYGDGGWGAAGLATGAVIGAAATYPYYNYPVLSRTRHRSRQRTADIVRPRSAPAL